MRLPSTGVGFQLTGIVVRLLVASEGRGKFAAQFLERSVWDSTECWAVAKSRLRSEGKDWIHDWQASVEADGLPSCSCRAVKRGDRQNPVSSTEDAET